MQDFINQLTNAAMTTGNAVINNPIVAGALRNAKNVAQDIGTGLGYGQTPGLQQSQNNAIKMAQQAEARAQQVTDPAEKARLLKVAGDTYQTVSQGAGQQAQSYSPDVNQNPLLRGAAAATEVGTGADIAAHPIQTIQGIGKMAGAVLHPIRTARIAADAVSNLPETIGNIGNYVKGEVANPDNFTMTGGNNAMTKLGNRVLASQFKGGDKVVRNPASTVNDLAEYGLTTPDQISNASATVTGSANAPEGKAILNKAVTKAVQSAGHIETGEITNPQTGETRPGMYTNAKNLLQNTTFMTPYTQKRILSQVARAGAKSADNIEGGSPAGMMQTLRDWESKVNDITDIHGNLKPNLTAEEKETGRVYQGLINDLKQRIFIDSGVNDKPLADFLSPADIQALSKIHPKLAADAQSASVLGGRSLQARFVNGSKMVNALTGADEGAIDPTEAIGPAAAAFGHPITGAAVAAAQTQGGRNLVGNTLRTIGSTYGTTPAQIPLDIAAQAPKLTAAGANEQNNNNPSDNTQNQGVPPIGSSISASTPNVNGTAISYDSLPTDSSQLKPDSTGLYSAPSPAMIIKNGKSLLDPNITDLNGQPLPQMNDANYNALKTDLQSVQNKYNPQAQALLDQATTANGQYKALTSTYGKYVDMNNKIANAITALQSAPPNILNNVKTVQQLNNIENGKYRQVGEALAILGQYYPTDVQGVLGAANTGVAIAGLTQASKDATATYVNYINEFTGNLPGSSSPNPGNSLPAPTQAGLPPLTSTGSNAGTGVAHPFAY